MVGRGWHLVLLAALLLTPTGEALPTAFDAELALPLHVAGVLAPTPDIPSHWVDGRLAMGTPSTTQVMTAPRALMAIETYRVDAPFSPATRPLPVEAPDVAGAEVEEFEVANAAMDVVRVDGTGQYRAQEWNWESKGRAAVRLDVEGCDLREPTEGTRYPFPQDPRGVPRTYDMIAVKNARDLEAACVTKAATFERPAVVRFYGVELVLRSDAGERRIQTGQFDRPGPGGVGTERVAQILRVQPRGDGLSFSFADPHAVHVHAPGFTVAGKVVSPATHGTLSWRERSHDGPLLDFSAHGTWLVQRGRSGHAALHGEAFAVQGLPVDGAATLLPAVTWGTTVAAALAVAVVAVRIAGLLFSRLRPDRVLEHPRRAAILSTIRQDPGTTVQAVARAMAIHWTHASYHVLALRRSGHVHVGRAGGRTALFATEGGHAPQSAVAWLRRPTHARVHGLLLHSPGSGPTSVARRLGLSQPRASQVLADLEAAGLVEGERVGRRVAYRACPTPDS